MPERYRTANMDTRERGEPPAGDDRERRDDDWRRGYDEAVRHGPPLEADVARGEYHPSGDWLAGAGVRGYGPPDVAERWGANDADQPTGHRSENARGTPNRGAEAGMQGSFGAAADLHSPRSWGRIGGWVFGGTGAQRPRGPKGYKRSDDRIREDLCEHLMDIGDIDSSDVEVHVKDGCVRLEGTVPERSMKYEIEDIAAATLGACDVENNLRVPRTRLDEGTR